jgi:hypothetical protein
MSEITRKAAAFGRFVTKHQRNTNKWLQDNFYDQACLALGICNYSTWVRFDPNDERWDGVFKESDDAD